MGGDDAMSGQSLQAVGEDIGGDAFVGREEFLEGTETAQHHVAENQKGPSVAEHFDGGVEGAPGAAGWRGVFGGGKGHQQILLAICKGECRKRLPPRRKTRKEKGRQKKGAAAKE